MQYDTDQALSKVSRALSEEKESHTPLYLPLMSSHLRSASWTTMTSHSTSKKLLSSTIQNAGLSLACITEPSSDSSDALLKAALMLHGASVSCKKKEKKVQGTPQFTKCVAREEILAMPATECSVCLCSIEASDDTPKASALRLDCGHTFHPDCIKRWFQRDLSCPTCRWQCKKMRHPKVKAAASKDDDGWTDVNSLFQAGDCVMDASGRVGQVVQAADWRGIVVLRYDGVWKSLRSSDELTLVADFS